jgi:tRNA-2-methylthio-N6-dimethylallyladenosine synthase
MPSVFIKTYGCQMNERDSEAVAAQFVACGYALAPSAAGADVVLLNTCSVRDTAEQKALGKMRVLAAERAKRRSGVVLGFLGCMAQSRGRELLDWLPGVSLVLGTQKFHRVVEHVEDLRAGRCEKVCEVGQEPGSEAAAHGHLLGLKGQPRAVTALVSIMQGCNQHCTFCIVPQTRGRERSRAIADIVAECRDLASKGVREVTLLGQIVTSYGRGEIPAANGKTSFVQLLEAVTQVDGLERVRFTAAHPKGYGQDLVEAYGRLPRLCQSAHVPVQSGSNRVLRLMRRGYTREQFLALVGRLRQVQPHLGLSTDLIAGFPGETDEDFEQTMSLVREAGFDCAFVFKYSPRRDTVAAAMPEQVPLPVCEQRHAQLLKLVNQTAAGKYQQMIGQRLEVLVEGPSRKNAARLEGRTRCNKIVVFEGDERHIGQLVPVRITRASAVTLYGEPARLNLA